MRTTAIISLLAVALLVSGCMMPDRDKQVAHNEVKLAEEGYIALKPGDSAPTVAVTAIDGTELMGTSGEVSGPVLLFFVTDVETPNSAKQTHQLNAAAEELEAAGITTAVVLPVGVDRAAEFAEKNCPALKMVADAGLEVSIAYGCAVDGTEFLQRTQVGIAADGMVAFFERGFHLATAKAMLQAFGLEPAK